MSSAPEWNRDWRPSSSNSTVGARRRSQTNELVCVKRLDPQLCRQRFVREIVLQHYLGSLRFPYFVRPCALEAHSARRVDVHMEFVPCDLQKVIEKHARTFTDEHVRYIMAQLLFALHCMHASGIVHRDVKPSNILVDANSNVKLCDFGLAAFVPHFASVYGAPSALSARHEYRPRRRMTAYVVTRYYRAPELLYRDPRYGAPVDVWAAGCVMGELLQLVAAPPHEARSATPPRPQPLFAATHCATFSPVRANGTRGAFSTSLWMRIVRAFAPGTFQRLLELRRGEERRAGASARDQLGDVALKNLEQLLEAAQRPDTVGALAAAPPVPSLDARFADACDDARDLLRRLLDPDPAARITAGEALRHPYLAPCFEADQASLFEPEQEDMHDLAQLLDTPLDANTPGSAQNDPEALRALSDLLDRVSTRFPASRSQRRVVREPRSAATPPED